VIAAIASSPEFQQRFTTTPGTAPTQEQIITALYQGLLQRQPSAQELANAVTSANMSGIQAVINGIVGSPEFRQLEVTALYQALLERLPDPAGLNGWIHSNLGLLAIRSALLESDEFFGR